MSNPDALSRQPSSLGQSKELDVLRARVTGALQVSIGDEVSDDETIIKESVDYKGIIRYYNYKGLHRDDGPVVIWPDGAEQWYQHGKLHRDDGPARIWPSVGVEDWWKYGELYEPSAHELMVWKMKQKKEC